MAVRHVILDRDGVLNEEPPGGGFVLTSDGWRWIVGALDALAAFTRAGIRVSIATNQSAVGRGLMTLDDLEAVHTLMVNDAVAAGAEIGGVFVCTHAPDAGCNCRKPAPALIRAAIVAAGVPVEESLVVGDDGRDVEAAQAAGVRAALVLTGKGRATAARMQFSNVAVYDDLKAVAGALGNSTHTRRGA